MNHRCIHPGTLLIPSSDDLMTRWACVACDQYTSQPEYWQQVALFVGDAPSTLNLIVPECYLAQAAQRVPAVHAAMDDYLARGVLTPAVQNGFILTERNTDAGARLGLVCLLDLEAYDYRSGSRTPVRASEETIQSRLPARMAVRSGASLELSHVLMLMDDPMHSVIEPLHQKRADLTKVYDFPLMMDGGHLTGYAVEDPQDIAAVYAAIDALCARQPADDLLLFAVGDGNHSLASAKACWEQLKPTLAPDQLASHPARFALVELENIHDDALIFEPIHRVVFGADGDDLLNDWQRFAAQNDLAENAADLAQEVLCVYEGKQVALSTAGSPHDLAVATLQIFLDAWLAGHPEARIDYIHGEDVVRSLVSGEGAVGFLLPTPSRDALIPTVKRNGVLPRKTFSMGAPNEKRFYMETRRQG